MLTRIVFSPVMYGCDNAQFTGEKKRVNKILNDADFVFHGQFIGEGGGVAHSRLGVLAVLMAFNLVAQVLKVMILRRRSLGQKDTIVQDITTAPITCLQKIRVIEP